MLDGFLIANKMVDITTRSKKDFLLFKVYFEKVYDRDIWDFLRYTMKRMNEVCEFMDEVDGGLYFH